ncbi:MAG TPA: enolase C-terminal domain-like protein [Candidatus Limnocylindrales bacterium]
MRISSVETIVLAEPEHVGEPAGWCTSPLDVFMPTRHERGRQPTPGIPSNVLVIVTTDDGLKGYGMVGTGSPAAAAVIDYHLRSLVLGEDPFNVELLWSRMYRTTINIGRRGLVLEAISAIDVAIWDILGKALGQPLYNLLGGQTVDRMRAYVSQSYARENLDDVAAEARHWMSQGFTGLKMRFGYGPVDGPQGMRKNVDLVRTVREAIGPDVMLAIDAYMGWDVTYAIRMIRMLDEFDLAWVEEPISPDDLDGFGLIRRSVNTPISTGEHEATRWGYRQLLERGAVDIIQPDVDRMGGITEARKVWALAAAFDIPVIPHGGWAHNAHLVLANMNSPWLEYFPADGIQSGYTFYRQLLTGQPEAVDGWVSLSSAPGLGVELDEAVLERHRL